MVVASMARPSWGSVRTPSAVPYTVTSELFVPTCNFTFRVAVSPERSTTFACSSVAKPCFETLTV